MILNPLHQVHRAKSVGLSSALVFREVSSGHQHGQGKPLSRYRQSYLRGCARREAWPKALTSLADVMETTHIGLCAMDRRAQSYDSIVPRTDPEWDARYKQFWAFHNPLWTLSTKWPANEIFFPDDLMPREDFVAMPIYNEWFRPAGFGLALMGSNLPVSDEASALIVAANGPGQEITAEQAKIFKAALRHINRAVGIHREFRICDLDHDIAPERLEHVGFMVFLVDASAKVLFANAWARALLIPGSGLTVRGGHLFSTDRASICTG
jgi:hypothetical protein